MMPGIKGNGGCSLSHGNKIKKKLLSSSGSFRSTLKHVACSMMRMRVFLLPLDGMLVHPKSPKLVAFCQVATTIYQYQFILLGGERHCESNYKVSFPITQENGPNQGWNPDSSGVLRTP